MAWSRTEPQMRALLDRLSDDDLAHVAEFELGSAGKRSMPKGQLLRHIDRSRGRIGSQRLSH
jgi:cytochrome c553